MMGRLRFIVFGIFVRLTTRSFLAIFLAFIASITTSFATIVIETDEILAFLTSKRFDINTTEIYDINLKGTPLYKQLKLRFDLVQEAFESIATKIEQQNNAPFHGNLLTALRTIGLKKPRSMFATNIQVMLRLPTCQKATKKCKSYAEIVRLIGHTVASYLYPKNLTSRWGMGDETIFCAQLTPLILDYNKETQEIAIYSIPKQRQDQAFVTKIIGQEHETDWKKRTLALSVLMLIISNNIINFINSGHS